MPGDAGPLGHPTLGRAPCVVLHHLIWPKLDIIPDPKLTLNFPLFPVLGPSRELGRRKFEFKPLSRHKLDLSFIPAGKDGDG